jgi:hypothetical protein
VASKYNRSTLRSWQGTNKKIILIPEKCLRPTRGIASYKKPNEKRSDTDRRSALLLSSFITHNLFTVDFLVGTLTLSLKAGLTNIYRILRKSGRGYRVYKALGWAM